MCKSEGIVHAPAGRGIDRIEARFNGNGYALHRHDTYALGITIAGVQTFQYRGSARFSLPGNTIIIHPDEVHDGGAGTEQMLHYRMLYLPPERLLDVAHGRCGLPFVTEPILSDRALQQSLIDALHDLDAVPSELLLDDIIARLHTLLWRHADSNIPSIRSLAYNAVLQCREYLSENTEKVVSSADLERVSGLDRYTLARHFRALLGTSPHRYLIMRRLQKSRDMIVSGDENFASIAAACGFADQSHLTRQFKASFGMTPGRWLQLTRASIKGGLKFKTLI